MTDRCEVARCRRPAALLYLGHGVCDPHWNRHMAAGDLRVVLGLDADATTEDTMAKKKTETNPTMDAAQAADVATTAATAAEAKPKAKRSAKAKREPKAAADAAPTRKKREQKSKQDTGPKPNRVFAIRVTDDELAAIHRASGPRNATRLIRTVAAAFAAEDEGVFRSVIKEARELRK